MALKGYAGFKLGKLGLAALGKMCAVTATTVMLSLGTAIVAVVAGAALVAQVMDSETCDSKALEESKCRKNQM